MAIGNVDTMTHIFWFQSECLFNVCCMAKIVCTVSLYTVHPPKTNMDIMDIMDTKNKKHSLKFQDLEFKVNSCSKL